MPFGWLQAPVWHVKGPLTRHFTSEACVDGLDPLLKCLFDLGAGLKGAALGI